MTGSMLDRPQVGAGARLVAVYGERNSARLDVPPPPRIGSRRGPGEAQKGVGAVRYLGTRLATLLVRLFAITAMTVGLSAAWAGAASADSLSLSLSSGSPALGTPITATVFTNAQPIDQYGDGPYLYEVIQPTSAGNCQPTYGEDEQVVGSQASSPGSNNTEVPTGSSTETFNVTEYAQATYEVCVWLETTWDDYSGSNVTSSQVTAASQATFSTVNTNTLSVAFSTTSPRPNVPFTVSLSGNATPTDDSGDGPDLYVVAQPTSAGGCQPTYGADAQVVGSRADSLDSGNAVSTGQFSNSYQFSGKAGSYEICAWLETTWGDSAGSGVTTSSVLASAGPVDFTVSAPAGSAAVCRVPRFHGATLATVKRRLIASHCRVGNIYRQRDRHVRRGRVIRLSHRVGATLTRGTRIGIYVSSGR